MRTGSLSQGHSVDGSVPKVSSPSGKPPIFRKPSASSATATPHPNHNNDAPLRQISEDFSLGRPANGLAVIVDVGGRPWPLRLFAELLHDESSSRRPSAMPPVQPDTSSSSSNSIPKLKPDDPRNVKDLIVFYERKAVENDISLVAAAHPVSPAQRASSLVQASSNITPSIDHSGKALNTTPFGQNGLALVVELGRNVTALKSILEELHHPQTLSSSAQQRSPSIPGVASATLATSARKASSQSINAHEQQNASVPPAPNQKVSTPKHTEEPTTKQLPGLGLVAQMCRDTKGALYLIHSLLRPATPSRKRITLGGSSQSDFTKGVSTLIEIAGGTTGLQTLLSLFDDDFPNRPISLPSPKPKISPPLPFTVLPPVAKPEMAKSDSVGSMSANSGASTRSTNCSPIYSTDRVKVGYPNADDPFSLPTSPVAVPIEATHPPNDLPQPPLSTSSHPALTPGALPTITSNSSPTSNRHVSIQNGQIDLKSPEIAILSPSSSSIVSQRDVAPIILESLEKWVPRGSLGVKDRKAIERVRDLARAEMYGLPIPDNVSDRLSDRPIFSADIASTLEHNEYLHRHTVVVDELWARSSLERGYQTESQRLQSFDPTFRSLSPLLGPRSPQLYSAQKPIGQPPATTSFTSPRAQMLMRNSGLHLAEKGDLQFSWDDKSPTFHSPTELSANLSAANRSGV